MKYFLGFFATFFLIFASGAAQTRGITFNDRASNQNVTHKNLTTVNSEAPDFAPMFYRNGLVFVTARQKSGPVDPRTGETYYQLYYAEFDPNGVPSKPYPFSVELNTEVNEGPLTFDPDQNLMYFSRNNWHLGKTTADSKGLVRMHLYEARRGPFDWEDVKELPFNNDEYSCKHPSLSSDGTKLFFTSDMPGGYGGFDLYVAERRGGSWMPPINLGPEINTNKNEGFPFIHAGGTLFFSSDGHEGYGGHDLFMIDLTQADWSKVINLGPPFNSAEDDFSLILTTDGQRGFFSSNRPEGVGKFDIYFFEAPGGIQGIDTPEPVQVPVAVTESSQGRPLSGVAVHVLTQTDEGFFQEEEFYDLELRASAGEGENMGLQLVPKKEDQLGAPRGRTGVDGVAKLKLDTGKDYLLIVSKIGYVTQELVFSTKGEKGLARPFEVVLEPENCISLTGMVISEKYDREVPNAKVRLINECTGEEEVIESNVSGVFEYCLTKGCDYLVMGEKEGYRSVSTRLSTVKLRGRRSAEVELRLTANSETPLREPIREGTVIVLENIYYDFDKSAIRKGEAKELEALVKLMKLYPSMEIELSAHTDCRGEEDYNLRLSLQRAEAARQFLIDRGIDPKRVNAIGYGEAYPRNDCNCDIADGCSEAEHQYNRRTEVKILRIEESVEVKYNKDGLLIKDRQ